MFLFSFNNSMCASSRDLTWLCVVIRIHHVLYRIGTSCTNCGVRRPTDGLCSRCLDLPYCKICKRHLPVCCFNEERLHICQVHLQIVLFLHVTIMCILHTGTNWIIIWHIVIVTRSLVCVSQNCEKRRTKRRTALNNVVSETSLPVTQFDTSFETMINTRQRAIDDIVQEALRQHGYWRVCSSIVCFSIAVNRCKFHFRLSHF